MAKNRYKPRRLPDKTSLPRQAAGRWVFIVVALLVAGAVVFALNRKGSPAPSSNAPTSASKSDLPSMDVNQAVMVTVELDFGPTIPSIAEAIHQIERRHEPQDGTGRVFAILDAYGEPTPDGKKLHMSMHVSSEKPGVGSLVFRRTGEVLWKSRIVPTTNSSSRFAANALTIFIDDGSGKLFTVDGSSNPASVLDATIKEAGLPLRDLWPEGAEREVTFIYSACGCPVKVMCRRVGERTMRAKELPVIFPDDPSVVTLIARLMGW
jgi:hypothetical protein